MRLSFDPTYKGWKRDNIRVWNNIRNCFDPTYKGWKLILLQKFWWNCGLALILPTRDGNSYILSRNLFTSSCFDPTYKGWKRVCPTSVISHDSHALILPTRDGNGNSITCQKSNEPSLWSYLQGMETWWVWVIDWEYYICFDPTYKGWKLLFMWFGQRIVKKLWSYLQGMETSCHL